MHPDLIEVIDSAKRAREYVVSGFDNNDANARSLRVKEANGIAAQNHAIISAHALDLRERIFAAGFDMPERRIGSGDDPAS
jgi:hypothetical protein